MPLVDVPSSVQSGSPTVRFGGRKASDETPSLVDFVGALVTLSSDKTNWSTSTDNYQPLDFTSEVVDTNGFWNGANPERLTIPAGVSRVKLFASTVFDWGNDGDHGNQSILWYDSSGVQKLFASSGLVGSKRCTGSNEPTGTRQTTPHTDSPWVEVEEGDYFVMLPGHAGFQASSSVDIKANVTFFGIVDYAAYADSFSGIKRARVSLSSNQTLSAVATDQLVNLDSTDYDADSLWDSGNKRFVIPAGATYARLVGNVAVQHSVDVARWKLARIKMNGSDNFAGNGILISGGVNTEDQVGGMIVQTAWVPVSEGDYFDVSAACEAAAAGTQLVKADTTYLSIEVW